MALPALRDELAIYPGPASRAGAPTWSIYDPVRNLYFRIDWPTFEILCRWHLDEPEQICAAIGSETTLSLDLDAVQSVVEFIVQRDLVKRATAEDSQRLDREFQRRKQRWYKQALHNYLFFRLPLLKPDRWIAETLPRVRWLGSGWFLGLTLLALLSGVLLVSRQWDSFTTSLVDLFSVKGLIAYAITLVSVKFLHELGHAYTAKHFGCRVPTMGIAFLVLFPMAYTDVNDVWRLSDKRQRLKVGAAGILTELGIAAWATLLWSIVPDGPLRTGLFLLATTTWISTLAINASPFLRFDGYFLLMDALELPNLHSRAFALARWRLREALFGLGDPQPEAFSLGMKRLLQLFAVGTWIYRLIVFGGIAILVYLMFPKPLGPFLGFIEIYWFIVKPILGEIGIWIERWREIVKTRRSYYTLGVLALLLALFVIPWDSRIDSPAILVSSESRPVVAPQAAQIRQILVRDGDSVETGELLLQLRSPDLESQRRAALAKAEGLKLSLAVTEIDERARGQLAILRSQLERIEAEIAGLNEQLAKLEVRALVAGRVTWFDQELRSGDWISAHAELGVVREVASYRVIGYVEQSALPRVSLGDSALFIDEVGRLAPIRLKVSQIDTDATRVLGQPLLASTRGGEILVREAGQQLIPEQAIYRVTLEPEAAINAGQLPELRGHLVIQGEPEAWSAAYYRSFMALLQREAGF